MADNPLAKNIRSVQPYARLLAKVDLVFAVYGLILVGALQLLFGLNPSAVRRYAYNAVGGSGQEDLQVFLEMDFEKQWTLLIGYFSWYILELLIAVLFFFGSKYRSYNLLKLWLIVTILNCVVGLATAIPVYLFTVNKTMFVTCAVVIYVYKLLEIYVVDLFLREIVLRDKLANATGGDKLVVAGLLASV